MVPIDEARRRTLGEVLLAWWQSWRHKREALAELARCGSEVEHVARDVGVTPGELRVLAAKRPDAADLLSRRLAALRLDTDMAAVTQVAVLRDLQRVCTTCEDKGRCARDLADHAPSQEWQTYCPNAETLKSLVTEAEDEKALARLERRQARARRVQ